MFSFNVKSMNKINVLIYFLDFLFSFSAFLLFFSLLCFVFYTTNIFYSIPVLLITAVFMYRAGAFTHELCHQNYSRELQPFKLLWNYTMGIIISQHSIRFYKTHTLHHTTGIFGTPKDPQYVLINSSLWLKLKVLFIAPLLFPLYNFIICFLSFLGIFSSPFHSFLYPSYINYSFKEAADIRLMESFSFFFHLFFLSLFPSTYFLFLLTIIISWYLSALRIPLEHNLKTHKEVTEYEDQIKDSYTHYHFLYVLLQPLGLRYHMSHHMFPKVPYHNLQLLDKMRRISDSQKEN